jgi:PAS domain S-box-containing protein
MLGFFKRLFGGTPVDPPAQSPTLHPAVEARNVAEAGMARAELHFDELVAGVQDYAIFMLDAEGRVATWNAGAQRLKGYGAEEIVGRHFSTFYPQDAIDRGWPAEELRRAVAAGRFEDEGWRLRKDGSRFWANVVITALRGPDGQPRGFSKVTRDLTERKRAEESLRQAHDELERRVVQRTQELSQANQSLREEVETRRRLEEELQQHVKELAHANRQKNEFLAMLAHELRNPLAPLRNALHLLKMLGGEGQAGRQAVGMMDRQLQHLVHLVDDLMDVSRIVSGKIDLRPAPSDLAAIVRRAVEIAQPVIDSHGHELILSLPPEPVALDADVVRLAQVFSNLLTNAAKYSPRAGRIWLSAGRDEDGVVVRVRDEGMGITAEMLPRVFDLFVQADHSLARTQGGLGVGLTLVRRLVEMHGGTIEARSEGPGKGSEFIVRLPARGEPRPAALSEPAAAAKKPDSRRVLVVDDNVDAAESAAALLRLWGHEVRTVHDGPSVLQVVREFRPHVLLLDVGLPGMTGYDVARQLREQEESGSMVLAAMTGYSQDDDARRSQEAGFHVHLIKPLDPLKLETLVAASPT